MTTDRTESSPPARFGFVLVPDYSMIAFASAVEPLRMANRLSNHELYSWITISADGQPVAASNGLVITPDCAMNEVGGLAMLFVCGGINIERACDKALLFWIRKLAHQKIPIGRFALAVI